MLLPLIIIDGSAFNLMNIGMFLNQYHKHVRRHCDDIITDDVIIAIIVNAVSKLCCLTTDVVRKVGRKETERVARECGGLGQSSQRGPGPLGTLLSS